MWNRNLRNAEHTRRYAIVETPAGGWEVRRERDSEVVHRAEYHDWHRVERARRSMTIEMNALEAAGWRQE